MRALLLLTGLLALLWALPATAGEPAVVQGRVADVADQGCPVWVLVAERQADLFDGRPDGAQQLGDDGAFRIELDPAPPSLFVWLLADRDGDGPDADDPFTSHRPWPTEAGPGAVIELEPSLHGTAFLRARTLPEWAALEGDHRIFWGFGALSLLAIWLLLPLGLWSLWASRGAPPTEPDEPAPDGGRWRTVAWLLVVTAAGLALRAWLAHPATGGQAGISEQAWQALALGGQPSANLFERTMHPAALGSFKQMLYIGLVRATGLGLSDAPEAARLWSVLAGGATIPALYALVRRWADRTEALLAAALVALLPLGVFFGAETAPYALHLLLVVLGTHWLLGASREGCARCAVGFAVASVLAYYLHMLHAMVMVAQVGFALIAAVLWWREPRQRRGQGVLWLALMPAGLLTAFWQVFHLGGSRFGAAFQQETGAFVVQQIDTLDLLTFSTSVSAGTPNALPWLCLLGPALWIGGLALLLRRNGTEALLLVLLAAGMLGFHIMSVVVMLETFDGGVNLVPHHLASLQAVLIPASAAAMAWLARRGAEAWRGGQVVGAGALLSAACLPLVTASWSTLAIALDPGRPDTASAAAIIHEQARDGDAYTTLPGFVYDRVAGWHLFGAPSGDPTALPSARHLLTDDGRGLSLTGPLDGLRVPTELLLPRPAAERLWVLTYAEERFGRPKLEHGRLNQARRALIDEHYELVEAWTFEHLELSLHARTAPRHPLDEAPLILDTPLELLAHRRLEGGSRRLLTLPARTLSDARGSGIDEGPRSATLELPLTGPVDAPLRLALDATNDQGCLWVVLDQCPMNRLPEHGNSWASEGACRLEGTARLTVSQRAGCDEDTTVTRVALAIDHTR